MEYNIKPYEGVGDIYFGMSSQQIQKVMSVEPRKFFKYSDDEYPTDVYDTFYGYYKKPGECEAVEFFVPSTITYNGMELFKKPYVELENYFAALDKNIEIHETGLISYKTGISIYAPFAKTEPTIPPEGVMVFEKDYYE
jgi:hypothetical protein